MTSTSLQLTLRTTTWTLFLPLSTASTSEISRTLISYSNGQSSDLSAPLHPLHTFCDPVISLFSPSINYVLASFLSLPRPDLMYTGLTTLFWYIHFLATVVFLSILDTSPNPSIKLSLFAKKLSSTGKKITKSRGYVSLE